MIFVQISMSVRQQTLLVQQDMIASTIWEAMLVIVQGDLKARPVKLVSYFISIRGLLNFPPDLFQKEHWGEENERNHTLDIEPHRTENNTILSHDDFL